MRIINNYIFFNIGYTFIAAMWMYTLKSVRFLVLNKGGDKLSFVTYTPFGKNRILTVPINKVGNFKFISYTSLIQK